MLRQLICEVADDDLQSKTPFDLTKIVVSKFRPYDSGTSVLRFCHVGRKSLASPSERNREISFLRVSSCVRHHTIEHDHAEDFSRRMIINMSFIRQASWSLSKCDRAEKDEGHNFLQIMDGWLFFFWRCGSVHQNKDDMTIERSRNRRLCQDKGLDAA